MSTEGGIKAVLAALVANVGIAISKFVAFLLTGSSSMLSESVHSLADSGNQVLLLVGNRHSKRTTTEKHQFGYGRVRYIYGFIVAIVLFVIGGIFSLYEGIHKVQNPEEVSNSTIALAVLTVAVILESFSLRTALREVNAIRGKRTLWQFVRAARQPELPVIVLEDIGALLGLIFAFIGVGISAITKNSQWDGMGAIAVGLLLVVIAVILTIEMTSMLVGESALSEDIDAIEKALQSASIVQKVIHLRTLYVGPDELLVACKIAVSSEQSGAILSSGIDEAEKLIRASVPHARYIFIEPDIYKPS
ncbi:MAG: cation diffusion facilitator family transporter [Actinobacteria bacterium]|nr:cation diffusion facilitator family transporter [Actinomycetota bacterium]